MLTRRNLSSARSFCEPVERRILFVTFFVTGTNGSDMIDLVVGGGLVTATVNGTPTSMSDATVTDVAISALGGNDTVTIRSNGDNPVTYDGGFDDDNVTLGNPVNGMQSILADITLTNPGAFNHLIFDDTANAAGRTANIDVLNIAGSNHGRIMGLAPGTLLYKLADTAQPVTINCGSGADTLSFRSTLTVPIVANGGAGNDIFNFGDANLVGSLDGIVTVNGNADSDEVIFNDQSEKDPLGFTVNATTVARFGMATMTYGTVEQLTINAGNTSVGALHNINSTSAATPVRLNAGPSNDTINVNETDPAAPVTIGPSSGEDFIRVNDDASGTASILFEATQRIFGLVVRSGGTARLTPGGDKVLTLNSLEFSGNGTLDLADGDMIVDYTGDSLLGVVQAALTSGYAAGAWNGSGINSSAAASTPGTALGFAESSEIFTTFPATFAGQMVDNSAVLVKHTFYGDANLSGGVTLQDFNRLAGNFGQSPRRWVHGNFDFDMDVDLPDFNRLAGNFGAMMAVPQSPFDTESQHSDDLLR